MAVIHSRVLWRQALSSKTYQCSSSRPRIFNHMVHRQFSVGNKPMESAQSKSKLTKEMVFGELRAMISLAVGGVVFFTAFIASSGFLVETANSWNEMKPPGSIVSIENNDGDEIHVHVQKKGKGNVTVILDGGVGETSFDWHQVANGVAEFARVLIIDRPGLGFSEAGSSPRTAMQISKEYEQILAKLNVSNNILLVGHGSGGYNMRQLALSLDDPMVPKEVKCKGLVLVDCLEENTRTELESISEVVHGALKQIDENGNMLETLAKVGLVRLIFNIQGKSMEEKYSKSAYPYVKYYFPSPKHRRGCRIETQGVSLTEEYFREKSATFVSPHQFPTVVLSHGKADMFEDLKYANGIDATTLSAMEQKWQEGQMRLLRLYPYSPKGDTHNSYYFHHIVKESGYEIHQQTPEEIVKVVQALVKDAETDDKSYRSLEELNIGICL